MPHIRYYIDTTTEVYVVCNNKVLLRKHDKYKIWLSVGGHIEPNEDPNQAAVREVKEEVGLNIQLVPTTDILSTDVNRYKHLITPAFMNRHKINENHEHVTLVYFAKSNDSKIKQGEQEKSDECQWFTLEELENLNENISETVRRYAKKAIEWVGKNE